MAGPLDKPIYTPQPPHGTDVSAWAYREFIVLSQVLTTPPAWKMDVINTPPTRPRAGLFVYADGTNWNPGSGEGLYVYKSTGWSFLGSGTAFGNQNANNVFAGPTTGAPALPTFRPLVNADLNYASVHASSTAMKVQGKLDAFFTDAEYNTQGYPTDDTSALQTAINAAAAAGVKLVLTKPKYRVTGLTLASGAHIEGSGVVLTQIVGNSAVNNIISITSAASHITIRDLFFTSDVTMNSGTAAIYCNNTGLVRLEDITVDGGAGKIYDAILMQGGSTFYNIFVKNCWLSTCNNSSIHVKGSVKNAANIWVENCSCGGSGTQTFGMYIECASGMSIIDTEILAMASHGVALVPAASNFVTNFVWKGGYIDTCVGNGVNGVLGSGAGLDASFIGCSINSNGDVSHNSSGIFFDHGTNLAIAGCYMTINHGPAIYMTVVGAAQIVGNRITGNNQNAIAAASGGDGIYMDNTTNISISGNHIGSDSFFSNGQKYGIYIGTGCTGTMGPNDLTGNVTGTYSNNSGTSIFIVSQGQITGTVTNDNAFAGNIGEFVSADLGFGSATPLVSGTSKTVTSISLAAGDWDVTGYIGFTFNAATTLSYVRGDISTVNNTQSSADSFIAVMPFNNTTLLNNPIMTVGPARLSIASTTTVYLVATSVFAVNTNSAWGQIQARRMR